MPLFTGDGEQERNLSETSECGNYRSYVPIPLPRVIGDLRGNSRLISYLETKYSITMEHMFYYFDDE